MAQRENWGDCGMMSAVPVNIKERTETAKKMQAIMDSLPAVPTPDALLQWAEGRSFGWACEYYCTLSVKNGVLFYEDEEGKEEFSSFLHELQEQTIEVDGFNLYKILQAKMKGEKYV